MMKLEESTKQLNKNWQAFLYLIIEKASCIDDSHYWEYYYLVKNKQLVGLCTIFNNYLRQEQSKIRLSQFVVMPQFH